MATLFCVIQSLLTSGRREMWFLNNVVLLYRYTALIKKQVLHLKIINNYRTYNFPNVDDFSCVYVSSEMTIIILFKKIVFVFFLIETIAPGMHIIHLSLIFIGITYRFQYCNNFFFRYFDCIISTYYISTRNKIHVLMIAIQKKKK